LTAEAVAIQLESGATIPNNNRFYGMSLEGPWGRKVFNQGRDNYFLFCRYEGEPATDGVQTMVASGGTGYPDTGTISASSGGFEGEFTASGGAIASVTITNQGSGYSTPPTPIFSGSGSGAQSTLTLGDGYTIEFDGTDADANALLWGNKLKDNKVLNSSGALGNQKIDSSVADLTNQTKVASLSLLRSVVDASAETADEVIVGVDSDTNAVTVTLRGTDVVPGRVVTVKDETGNAGTNNITIATGELAQGHESPIREQKRDLLSQLADLQRVRGREHQPAPETPDVQGLVGLTDAEAVRKVLDRRTQHENCDQGPEGPPVRAIRRFECENVQDPNARDGLPDRGLHM
jgi:hypothetical protein